ncbi:MAG: hypothetical protein JNM62_03175 [Flavobacteriales bacterium]|nr:hypothetical protein [Flavobacteriales bacterium]
MSQAELTVPLVLNGPEAQDRQIVGLELPTVPDAALSTAALRTTATGFVTVSGTLALQGALVPAPTVYTTGMLITIIPQQANSGAATLNLNGLGDRTIVKRGGLPLDSADLLPDMPMRLLFDGVRFHALGSIPLRCPPGFSAMNREYCVADSSRDTTTFYQATLRCASLGARLCTFNEWVFACQNTSGFLTTVLSAEWVDHAANHANTAKLLGVGDAASPEIACDHGTLSVPTGLFRYRCCASR